MSMLTVVGACLTLCFIPVILSIFTIFYIVTWFVKLLIKIKYKDKALKATGQDVLFGMDSSKSFTIKNLAIKFTGPMNVQNFKSRVLDVILHSVNQDGQRRYRRLTQTYSEEFGYTLWKDYENFNIDQHISVIHLKDFVESQLEKEKDRTLGPINWSYKIKGPINSSYKKKLSQIKDGYKNADWKTLMKIILNEYGADRIASELPQWQIFFLEESDESYTLLFRIHHAISDGVYLARMLCEDFLETPTELFHNYIPPSKLRRFLINLWSFTLVPFGVWNLLRCNDKNELHGPGLSGDKRSYLSNSMDLNKLRYIKQRTNVGVHSIMFSCLSSALASHFARRSTAVKDITTLIPVPRQNLQKPIMLQNQFAVLTIKLPTPPRMNPAGKDSLYDGCSSLERLDIINKRVNEAKRDPTFNAMHTLITAFCSLLPKSLSKLMISTKGITLAFTNMPGPQSEISSGEDRIDEIMFWVADRDPLGTGISVFSYNGKFRVGLSIDEVLLKDETEGDLLLQDFENELENVLQELDQPKHAKKQKENSKFLNLHSQEQENSSGVGNFFAWRAKFAHPRANVVVV